MHIDSKARPSRNVAEPGRDKRVPPESPRSPDATSASLPERRGARTRQARPSRIAVEPGCDKRAPPGTSRRPDATSASLPGSPQRPDATSASLPERRGDRTPESLQSSKEPPFSGGTGLSRPQHSPASPRENKGRGLRRALCLAFSGITRDAVAYLVSAAFMNLAVSAVTVMTALPSANARFEAL